jgi:hypothetical protein
MLRARFDRCTVSEDQLNYKENMRSSRTVEPDHVRQARPPTTHDAACKATAEASRGLVTLGPLAP